jgi:hypothetical protein
MAFEVSNQAALDEAVDELESEAQSFDVSSFRDLEADFCKAWPFIRKALNTAKHFTPAYVDAVIEVIVEAGQKRCGL